MWSPSKSLITTFMATSALVAQGAVVRGMQEPEHLIKAKCLGALADFVTWPNYAEWVETGRPLVLGILGSSAIDPYLNEIYRTRLVKGKPLTIRRFKTFKEQDSCDILFISEQEGEHLRDILRLVKGKPILTICDSPTFAKRGVMVNLLVEQDRVRLEINLGSVRASGLEVGSRVLKLAKLVE